jgi:hypothetical protein
MRESVKGIEIKLLLFRETPQSLDEHIDQLAGRCYPWIFLAPLLANVLT